MRKKLKRLLATLLTGSLLCMPTAGAEQESSVFTREMIDRSLTAVGNPQRFQRAVEKARNGENVTIAYLGGSITEGALAQPQLTKCYAYLSAKHFAERYMPDTKKLMYVNAGISGTPSLLGITRLEQDVLSKKPDIVFVEFAVNDSTDMVSRIVYESLVRKLLTSDTEPAVILLFTLTNTGYSAQSHMQDVGAHYDLGMVSVRDAVLPQINAGKMAWSDYSSDYTHPNNEGHAFIATLIDNYFAAAEAAPAAPWSMPEKVKFGNTWEHLRNVRPGDEAIVSEGSFPHGNASCYSYRSGWVHRAALGGTDPFVLRTEGRNMTVAFKQERNPNCATAEVWVDGKLMKKLPGYAETAWGNVVTEHIFLGAGTHDIEIRLDPEDQNKTFTLLDIGIAP